MKYLSSKYTLYRGRLLSLETALIALGDKHRMSNPSESKDMILIEVQTGTYFGEDDIVRIEDDYNRG